MNIRVKLEVMPPADATSDYGAEIQTITDPTLVRSIVALIAAYEEGEAEEAEAREFVEKQRTALVDEIRKLAANGVPIAVVNNVADAAAIDAALSEATDDEDAPGPVA